MDVADLAGAEIYVETADPPVAGGRWYVLSDDTVFYQRRDGGFNPTTVVPAATLRTNLSWRSAGVMDPALQGAHPADPDEPHQTWHTRME